MILVPARKTDLALLAHWNQQLILDEGSRNRMGLAQLQRRMGAWLKGDYRALLFKNGRDFVGYLLYRVDEDHIHLRQFFVDRKHRRRRLGTAALRKFQKEMRQRRRPISLEVLIHNKRALAFWKSAGFRPHCLTLERR